MAPTLVFLLGPKERQTQLDADFYRVLALLFDCRGMSLNSIPIYLELFRERLSEKVHAAIPKGIAGGFEGTVLQRNLKEWYGRSRTYFCEY